MVVREPALSESVKYWVKPDIENRIAAGEIKAYFNSRLTRITPATVEVQTPEGKLTLDNDFVLAMTGYKPDFTFLESPGWYVAALRPTNGLLKTHVSMLC